ncbi:spore coat protein [Anoxybacterium hadale]|uniref:Spore coat protein n=1 Tax=Anoxybacterium hadale TaxID=3408580 RepID=A0ACD1ADI6_9FIRM|nr:spore coat protein [Clostridiales bacterium]
MQGQLSQKERMFLEDLKTEEDLCVTKYTSYAQQAQDPQLSQLFNQLANAEQQHYNTINQLIQSNGQNGGQQSQSGGQQNQSSQGGQSGQGGQQGGQTWKPSAGGKQLNQSAAQAAQQQMQSASANIKLNGSGASGTANNTDKVLLQDMLSTEKYVSSAYDTSIFESAQPTVRQALQHIQKEEQQHGEQLFQYMNSHGMYQVQ